MRWARDASAVTLAPTSTPRAAGGEAKSTSIEKVLTVHAVLLAAGEPLRLTDIARRAELTKPTAHRVVRSLMGACLIADLPRVRRTGFSSWEHGPVTCVAVAVPVAGARVAFTLKGRGPIPDRVVLQVRSVAGAASSAVLWWRRRETDR